MKSLGQTSKALQEDCAAVLELRLHPMRRIQAIREAIAKMTPMVRHNRENNLPWNVFAIEARACEDERHVMFYGNTGTDHWVHACVPYDLTQEEWSNDEWLHAFDSVAAQDGPVCLGGRGQ